MALSASIKFPDNVLGFDRNKVVKSAGIVTRWVEAITAGGAGTADNTGSDITQPQSQITDSTRRIVKETDSGTLIALRLGYDNGFTPSTDPDVQVFGRYNSDEPWQLLRNLNGGTDSTLTTASSDVTDGTLLYTTVDLDTQIFDLLGCREILVGVKTALAGSGGNGTSNSIIEAKLVN